MPAWERGFVEPIRSVRDVVETPVAWIRSTVMVSQQWSLYQAPIASRYRMWIEGLRDRSWTILYRAGDAEHTEDKALIEHARVWGTWNPTDEIALEYAQFTAWITAHMLADHPELAAVRVRLERIEIGHGEYTPTGTFEWLYQRSQGAK